MITGNLGRKAFFSFVVLVPVYLVFFLFLDRPIDRWVQGYFGGTAMDTASATISLLAYSPVLEIVLALCLIVGLIGTAVPREQSRMWAYALLYICISCAVAIVIGEGLKVLLGRYRPVALFQSGKYGFSFFSMEWVRTSTPSGHTFRIFAIMTALAVLLPRGRVFFFAVAGLVGLSRVALTAHYPSDVLFGAFIGIFSALWVARLAKEHPPLPFPRSSSRSQPLPDPWSGGRPESRSE